MASSNFRASSPAIHDIQNGVVHTGGSVYQPPRLDPIREKSRLEAGREAAQAMRRALPLRSWLLALAIAAIVCGVLAALSGWQAPQL